MCRLVAYLGEDMLLADILVKPFNSIVMQSLHARESKIPTNGDGFGLGWYAHDISPDPAIFTSISPAWNDRNLLSMTAKIKSDCFFAHVRSASIGGVTTYNCHPFQHKQFLFMHNGEIPEFIVMKRHLRHLLDDDIYHWIQGETDSEHTFALFLQMAKGKDLSKLEVVADVFKQTLASIRELAHQFNTPDNLYFNICMTDGHRLLASRYCSNPKNKPESMHYHKGGCHFSSKHPTENVLTGKDGCILISSEKLTKYDEDWEDFPVNSLLLVDKERRTHFISLDV